MYAHRGDYNIWLAIGQLISKKSPICSFGLTNIRSKTLNSKQWFSATSFEALKFHEFIDERFSQFHFHK